MPMPMDMRYIESAGEGFTAARDHIAPPKVVLDLGCGIRPQPLWPDAETICADAHASLYASGVHLIDIASEQGVASQLDELLPTARRDVEVVTLLDVIEHVPVSATRRLVEELRDPVLWPSLRGVVIATPYGYVPQEATGENPLQAHMSGWWPVDLARLGCAVCWVCLPRYRGTAWMRGGWQLAWMTTR